MHCLSLVQYHQNTSSSTVPWYCTISYVRSHLCIVANQFLNEIEIRPMRDQHGQDPVLDHCYFQGFVHTPLFSSQTNILSSNPGQELEENNSFRSEEYRSIRDMGDAPRKLIPNTPISCITEMKFRLPHATRHFPSLPYSDLMFRPVKYVHFKLRTMMYHVRSIMRMTSQLFRMSSQYVWLVECCHNSLPSACSAHDTSFECALLML
jgi:hypothetical protein